MSKLPENFTNGFIIGEEYKYIQIAYVWFWFSVIFAFITFSLAFFTYIKILTNSTFKHSHIYKLIIFNGVANCMQYYAYMLSNSMGIIPNLHGYFAFLMNNNLVHVSNFSHLLSFSVQSSTSLLITLNRLLSMIRTIQLRNNDGKFFKVACILSFILPFAVSIPVFFSYCFYDPVKSPTGQIHYVPVVFPIRMLLPWAFYILITNCISNVMSGALAYQLMKIRRKQKASALINTAVVSKVEQGLILSLICSAIIHLVLISIIVLTSKFQATVLSAFLSPIVALYTGSPFWSLIIFVPSVRNCLFSGWLNRRLILLLSDTSHSAFTN